MPFQNFFANVFCNIGQQISARLVIKWGESKKWSLFQEELKKNGRQAPTPLLSPFSLNRSHKSHYPWTHREDQVNFHFLTPWQISLLCFSYCSFDIFHEHVRRWRLHITEAKSLNHHSGLTWAIWTNFGCKISLPYIHLDQQKLGVTANKKNN